jgi:hypothetical protein
MPTRSRKKKLPISDWLPVKAVLEKPVKPDALFAAIKTAMEGAA